jgi:hypothetical protein
MKRKEDTVDAASHATARKEKKGVAMSSVSPFYQKHFILLARKIKDKK